MALDSIPPEVLDAILSPLDRSMLKAIRRVNKLLSKRIAPLLFKDLEVWLQAGSLARLVSIANHETLSQQVRNLTITNDFVTTRIMAPADLIDAVHSEVTNYVARGTSRPISDHRIKDEDSIDLERFVELGFSHPATGKMPPEKLQELGWPQERLYLAWKLQRDIAIEHAQLLDTDEDLEAVTAALKRFPNLSSIRLSGDGIGGPSKLRANGMPDYVSRGETSRADGDQLGVLMLAAADAAVTDSSSSTPFKSATVTSLIVDEEFWDEDEKTFTDPSTGRRPDFGTVIELETLRGAAPFFANLTTLKLPVRDRSYFKGRKIGANLACFLAALPKLEHLTLYNPGLALLSLSDALSSMTTRSLSTLELQCCILRLPDMQNLFEVNSKTLNSVQIQNVSLLEGRFVDFFTSLRNAPKLDEFGLNGWIVEAENDRLLYCYCDETDVDRFYENRERRYLAREAIIDFVLHGTDDFPTELLDTSSFLCRGLGGLGLNVLIGASKLCDTGETDYEYEI